MRAIALRGVPAAAVARVRQTLEQALAGWLQAWAVPALVPDIRQLATNSAMPVEPTVAGGGLELPDGRGLEWQCAQPDLCLGALLDMPAATFAAAPWSQRIAEAVWADLGECLCKAFALPHAQWCGETGRSGRHWTDARTAALGFAVDFGAGSVRVRLSAAQVEAYAPPAARGSRRQRLQPRTALVAGQQLRIEVPLALPRITVTRLRQLVVGDVLLSDQGLEQPLALRMEGRPVPIHVQICADASRRAIQIQQLEEISNGSFTH